MTHPEGDARPDGGPPREPAENGHSGSRLDGAASSVVSSTVTPGSAGARAVPSAPLARWSNGVGFRADEFAQFAAAYFADPARSVLLLVGAGFDPRAPRLAEYMARWAPGRVRGAFIREERPTENAQLRELADSHLTRLRAAIPELDEHQVNIFSPEDLAVVGGRRAAAIVRALDLSAFTDIVVDLSALSVGTSFPLVRALLEAADNGTFNLHAVVVADAGLDASITPLPGDAVIDLHGFRGELGLESRRDAALLWLPQLAFGRREMLARVHADLSPHDICPILPFPAHDPRLGDALVEEYLELLTDTWAVDPRNFIYAAEEDPLDVYRTILELDDARRPVFEGDGGGSLLVLSPVGSKVLALGALMAAAERDFPVRHIEAVGFEVDLNRLQKYDDTQGTFAHVWLAGAPYQATADNSIAAPRSTGAP